ncbi:glutaredoxin family protein [Chloroflexota bacterium]
MSVESDISKFEKLVKQAESYTDTGIWEPERHEEMVDAIIRADDIYNRIISEDKEKATEMVKLSGRMAVPVTLVDGQVLTGYDQSQFDRLFS